MRRGLFISAVITLTPWLCGDVNVAGFLRVLDSHRIDYDSPGVAVADGYLACAKLAAGETATQVAQEVVGVTNLDGYHAGVFVGAAIAAFCPQYRG